MKVFSSYWFLTSSMAFVSAFRWDAGLTEHLEQSETAKRAKGRASLEI